MNGYIDTNATDNAAVDHEVANYLSREMDEAAPGTRNHLKSVIPLDDAVDQAGRRSLKIGDPSNAGHPTG
jgi:hypothetical protein